MIPHAVSNDHTGMDIIIKSFGDFMKPITLNVSTSDTVLDVKTKIHDIRGIPPEEQQLVFAGKKLDDGLPLNRYGIQHEATLHLKRGT